MSHGPVAEAGLGNNRRALLPKKLPCLLPRELPNPLTPRTAGSGLIGVALGRLIRANVGEETTDE